MNYYTQITLYLSINNYLSINFYSNINNNFICIHVSFFLLRSIF